MLHAVLSQEHQIESLLVGVEVFGWLVGHNDIVVNHLHILIVGHLVFRPNLYFPLAKS